MTPSPDLKERLNTGPERIWATVNGMSTRLPDGGRQMIGGWSDDRDRPRAVEYVRADVQAARIDALEAELREARAAGVLVLGDDDLKADNARLSALVDEVVAGLEPVLFDFFTRKYAQRSDERQKAMGLQYMSAETRDLAKEIANFISTRAKGAGHD